MTASAKQSTKVEDSPKLEPKREFFLPDYGVTIEASSLDEAIRVAEAQAKQASKQES
jgi:hypothetical protein